MRQTVKYSKEKRKKGKAKKQISHSNLIIKKNYTKNLFSIQHIKCVTHTHTHTNHSSLYNKKTHTHTPDDFFKTEGPGKLTAHPAHRRHCIALHIHPKETASSLPQKKRHQRKGESQFEPTAHFGPCSRA